MWDLGENICISSNSRGKETSLLPAVHGVRRGGGVLCTCACVYVGDLWRMCFRNPMFLVWCILSAIKLNLLDNGMTYILIHSLCVHLR